MDGESECSEEESSTSSSNSNNAIGYFVLE